MMRRFFYGSLLLLVATAVLAVTISGTNGSFTQTVSGRKITTTYTPNPGNPTCNSIYMIQTCKITNQSGSTVEPKNLNANNLKHLQDDMTEGGTFVDHVNCEKDPYYNGEDPDKDVRSEGSRGATSSTPTTMSDRPRLTDDAFAGSDSVMTCTFEVCAVCADNGSVLDCITWTYTRHKGDGTSGSVSAASSSHQPSDEFTKAKKKFDRNHKNGTVCPEARAELNSGWTNFAIGVVNTVLPIARNLPWLFSVDAVNLGGMDVFGVQYDILLDGAYLTSGVIPEIASFDFETVLVDMPPLDLGSHGVAIILDPMNEIPEFDEDDNGYLFEFEILESSATPERPIGTGLYLAMLKPNPTHGRFSALLRLGSESPARLSVVDVRGRIVQSRTIQGSPEVMRTESFHLDSRLGAGVYFLRVEQDGFQETRKFIMLK